VQGLPPVQDVHPASLRHQEAGLAVAPVQAADELIYKRPKFGRKIKNHGKHQLWRNRPILSKTYKDFLTPEFPNVYSGFSGRKQ
jgi:hypothetical protein